MIVGGQGRQSGRTPRGGRSLCAGSGEMCRVKRGTLRSGEIEKLGNF